MEYSTHWYSGGAKEDHQLVADAYRISMKHKDQWQIMNRDMTQQCVQKWTADNYPRKKVDVGWFRICEQAVKGNGI
jgi:hypothetical protein